MVLGNYRRETARSGRIGLGDYWVTQMATAMGNWRLAAPSRQPACSRVTSPTEFFGETSNQPGDSAPLQPRFGIKSPLKRKRFQTIHEIEENMTGQLMVIGRTV